MFKKIFFVTIIFSLFVLRGASASTAGQVSYDSFGNPLPVQDSIISVPNSTNLPVKRIIINLTNQTLSYGGIYPVNEIKISSGLPRTPTPVGNFKILAKIPVKNYVGRNQDGTWYNLRNTKWNLRFSNLGYYIHGTYWHNNFGQPMSHGCVNVSYADMLQIYNFADVGTEVIIQR